jgi:hypothetical protein
LRLNQGAGKVLRVYSNDASNTAHRPTLNVTFQ